MITTYFDHENKWLVSKWEGEVTLDDIIAYIQRTEDDAEHPRRLKILTRAERAIVHLSLDDLEKISEANRQSLARHEVIIDAFVVDVAISAALTTLYQQVSSVKNYIFKIFSSSEAAEEWLSNF